MIMTITHIITIANTIIAITVTMAHSVLIRKPFCHVFVARRHVGVEGQRSRRMSKVFHMNLGPKL